MKAQQNQPNPCKSMEIYRHSLKSIENLTHKKNTHKTKPVSYARIIINFRLFTTPQRGGSEVRSWIPPHESQFVEAFYMELHIKPMCFRSSYGFCASRRSASHSSIDFIRFSPFLCFSRSVLLAVSVLFALIFIDFY